uniref:Formin-like protein n=1 Tax=Solanum tuberosum TaxID=4113 RepID=M1AVU2_SOLTU
MEPNALNGSKSEIPLGTVTGIAVAAAGVSEQIPPGRMGMQGQPPLKPPPGRVNPFEDPTSLANPDHFNMIESLFGYAHADKDKNGPKKDSMFQDASKQYVQIIDQKKAQNLAILLKALNVTTEEVCDALKEAGVSEQIPPGRMGMQVQLPLKPPPGRVNPFEDPTSPAPPPLPPAKITNLAVVLGNELPSELLQTLLKIAPTADEELKLRLYNGDLSRLGPAERFLKVLVDIPFAFKRLESLLFMCSLEEEASMAKESFATLEAACTELRKTGNRMNDGTFRGGAQAFKLDTLLKLSDVKGIDGKTTLLHFVVQEIIRSEGIRAARARDRGSVSSIKSDDLPEDQPQDAEEYYRSTGLQVVSGTVSKLGRALKESRDFLNSEMKNVDDENRFHQTLKSFVQNAELDIMWLFEEEKRIMALVKSTGDYFHGNAGKDEGLRLFVIVHDFLNVFMVM